MEQTKAMCSFGTDESVLTDGKIDPKKLRPIAYDSCNNTYTGLGDVVGKAFSDGLQLK